MPPFDGNLDLFIASQDWDGYYYEEVTTEVTEEITEEIEAFTQTMSERYNFDFVGRVNDHKEAPPAPRKGPLRLIDTSKLKLPALTGLFSLQPQE